MLRPLVSVLLPAFNAAATLGAALRSVQRQRERRWECVVVDDGSCDATAEVAGHAARRDPRLSVVSVPHAGVVPALNAGLERCRAPLVARMDADDCMHPDRLARQLALLETAPDLAGTGCGVRLFPRAGLTSRRLTYEGWLNGVRTADDVRRELFVECPLAHPTLTLRTAVLRRLGYRDQGWPEDYDLLLRLHGEGFRLGTVPAPLLAWRDHPGRLSRTGAAYRLDAFVRARAHFLAELFLDRADDYVLWGYGPTGRGLRAALGRHGCWPRHIVEVHPRRIGVRIHGAQVIHPDALDRRRHTPLVAAVSGAAARAEIRRLLAGGGWREGRDFVCAA